MTQSIDQYFTVRGEHIDLIVPIIRSGMITAMHIASKLKITNILPTQYKYEFLPQETLVKKIEFPQLHYSIPEQGNILIVDSNTVFGGTAKLVIADTHNAFPNARLYFASANLDQSVTELEDLEHVFHGQVSNERKLLTAEEAASKNIDNRVIIFPWENLEEQWSEISSSQDQII